MQSDIIITADGSHSIYIPGLNVTYHSRHGAIQESTHIFIQSGLSLLLNKKDISIFELGFGTGLNALLSIIATENTDTKIYYETVEMFPLSAAVGSSLNYTKILNRPDLQEIFMEMHHQSWNTALTIGDNFILNKREGDINDIRLTHNFDIIYFDAFDPLKQPALWTKDIFTKLCAALNGGGLLLTYCSKSIVRKAMKEAGFTVTKIPGPHGKREIVRAVKQSA